MTTAIWSDPAVKWSDPRWGWSGNATTGKLHMSVIVGGVERNCETLRAAIRVGGDRPAIVQPVPEAPSATLELIDPDGSMSAGIPLSAPVVLAAVRGDLATSWTRFVGEVTDNSWRDGRCTLNAVSDQRRMGWSLAGGVDWPQETDGARATRIATAAGRPVTVVGAPELLVRDRVNQDYRSALAMLTDLATDCAGRLVQQPDGTLEYQTIGWGERTPTWTVLSGCRIRQDVGSRLDTDTLINRIRLEPMQETTHLWVDAVWTYQTPTTVTSGHFYMNPAWTTPNDMMEMHRVDADGVDRYAQMIQMPQSISITVDPGGPNEVRWDAEDRPVYNTPGQTFSWHGDMPESLPWAAGARLRVRITSPYRSPWTPTDLEAVDSYDTFGPHEVVRQVQLATATDVTRVASATLNRWNTPARRADSFEAVLDGSDWQQLDAFLGLRVGAAAQLDTTPPLGPLTDVQYVVDGWYETWEGHGQDGGPSSRMLLRMSKWTAGGRRWVEVTPTTTWATVPAGMRWTDADTAMPGAVRLERSRRLVKVV